MELMARDVLFNGKMVVQSEGYPAAVVDFERNPLNSTAAMTPWNSAAAMPLADIEATALTINQTSRGGIVTDLVMTGQIWDMLVRNQSVRDLLNRILNLSPGTSNLETGPRSGSRQARWRGLLSGTYNLWTYDGYFEDDNGVPVPIMPQDQVLFVCNAGDNVSGAGGIAGKKLYGAILDMDAGIQARKVFIKARNVWDPSGVEVLTQSSPMLAVDRPNASGTLKVM